MNDTNNTMTNQGNSIVTQEFGILHETQNIRKELMDVLTDADLSFKVPGNPTLGELCLNMGQVQGAYITSFKTFKQDWKYAEVEPGMASSVSKLKTWYAALDAELDAALIALSEDDIQTRSIDRGWPIPVGGQFHVYREALLIFYGKATVYLKAMGKALPQQMRDWIG